MKYNWVVALLVVPYGALVAASSGNPNGDGYVGQPGSTYDASANPAKTVGTVTYNPYAPMATTAPAPAPATPPAPAPAR